MGLELIMTNAESLHYGLQYAWLLLSTLSLTYGIYSIMAFITSCWWLTVNVLYKGDDLEKISYSLKWIRLSIFAVIASTISIVAWFKYYM